MYQVLIVDDEEIIRKGLVHYFDWNAIGFEVAGQFEDGSDAIRYLEEHPADAILTDVKMYEVSGIELARYVWEHCPQTKVAVLSGYRQFEYAQEAMKYGVRDYVLKPVDVEEIRRVFIKIRDALDSECEKTGSAFQRAFSQLNGKNYKEILVLSGNLVAAVSAGHSEEVYDCHEKWFALVEKAPADLTYFAVYRLFEELYIRFAGMGVNLSDSLEKELVLKRLEGASLQDLFLLTGNLLLEFTDYLEDKKGRHEESTILRAKKYIETHLAENFSIEDVARSVFLNRSYFSREFKQATGENVIDYVIKCRMDRAVELLLESRHSTAEISALCGYTDLKYFQRSFKKHTGYTVREYQSLLSL